MTDLIVCLGKEKGERAHAQKVIEGQEWEQIFIVTDKESKQGFTPDKECSYIIIDNSKVMGDIAHDIASQLKGQVKGLEVGLNLICGNGKQHMALISALLKEGLGIRLVALTKEGVKEL